MLITEVKNAQDALDALNQNFGYLVTKKRKVIEAKEVNNTIGKMTNVVKEQAKELDRLGDKSTHIPWLGVKKIMEDAKK